MAHSHIYSKTSEAFHECKEDGDPAVVILAKSNIRSEYTKSLIPSLAKKERDWSKETFVLNGIPIYPVDDLPPHQVWLITASGKVKFVFLSFID